jgi:hypothetical protein
MKLQAPNLAPTCDIATYLVLDEVGGSRVYCETEESDAEWAAVMRHISEGQYKRPLRVIAFNTAEGWSRDVTEDIARDMLDAAMLAGQPLTRSGREFIERASDHNIPESALGPL